MLTGPGSRQYKRRTIRLQAFRTFSERFPGLVRKVRRSIARDFMHNTWKGTVK